MTDKRKRGRPPNLSNPVGLTIGLPQRQFAFLTLLAKRGRLGVTETEIATHILVRELDDLERAKYHEGELPDE